MNTNLRRQDRAISEQDAIALLDAADYGILSTVGEDGVPYGVPLHFFRDGATLILHCAPEGRKLDNLRQNNRVSFCVVGKAEVLPEKFTTRYESVIVSGSAKRVEDTEQKNVLLQKLCEKYAPNHLDATAKMIAGHLDRTTVIVVEMETITGKANRQ